MAKELPYFRFTAAEWLNGDISLEASYLKGVFIDICAYYWFKDCSITKALLKKKFNNDIDAINELIKLEILKHDIDSDFLCINFLNDQFDVLSEQRKRRQKAGSKGGKQKSSNAKAKVKQSSSYKDKDKDKDKENNKYNIKGSLKAHVFSFKNSLLDLGIELSIVEDWLKVRAKKKAANTETAFSGLITQIEKSGLTANECIKTSVENSWAGFKAEWINKDSKSGVIQGIKVQSEKHYEEWD